MLRRLMMASAPPPTTVTWNPSDKGANIALSGGDLTAAQTVTGSFASVRATLGRSSGKYYFEVRQNQASTANFSVIGVCTSAHSMSTGYFADDANGWGYYEQDGAKVHNNTSTAYGASYTAADVIGVAVDFAAGKVWFSKNGTWQASGNPASGTNEAYSGLAGTLYPALSIYSNAPYTSMTGRFKSADFSYSPPSGFSAWES